MKQIPHILSKVYSEPWLITPEKHCAIQQALEAHLSGIGSDMEPDEDDMPLAAMPYITDIYGTAVMSVSGIIGKRLSFIEMLCGGYDLNALSDGVDKALSDAGVKRLVIDWDTPGGTVTGVPEAADELALASEKKRIISFCEMQCCSAGVWLATQAGSFYTTKSAQVGSIGCYAVYLDRTRQLDDAGVTVNAISAGKYKLTGAPFKPMTDEERVMLTAQVDKIHSDFKQAVSSKRSIDSSYMEGQIFDGEQAAQIGLTDGVVSSLPALLSHLSNT